MRFIDACLGRQVDTTPVWIMRQAGRYLPEYRQLRKGTEFMDFCKSPTMCTEATLQPLRRYDLDAAILFSDILVPVEAMGVPVEFVPEPRLPRPVRSAADVRALRVPDPATDTGFVMETVSKIRAAIPADKALIGFAGAPFTLATYMIEGGGSRDFIHAKSLMFNDPVAFRDLLDRLADTIAPYLQAQIDDGANAVQLFDTWAGLLSPADFEAFALPAARAIIRRVKRNGVPVIYFVNGIAPLVEVAQTSEADVLGVDFRVRLSNVIGRLGGNVAVQGNLDPSLLLGPAELLRQRAAEVVQEGRAAFGHVFNLGHGINKETPPESVSTLVDAVHEAGRR
jgi:uroporphyrinogen decarboxylase